MAKSRLESRRMQCPCCTGTSQFQNMARQRRSARESDATAEIRNSRDHRKFRHPKHTKPKTVFDAWSNKIALFVSFNIIVLILSIVYFCYQYYLENIIVTPLDVPKVVNESGLDVPSLYWGSYRPGLYFGLRTRSSPTLALGLMWFSQQIVNNGIEIRHWCDQWNDVKKYGWLQHDGENFGIQEIHDKSFIITTSFSKKPGGKDGGDITSKFFVRPKFSVEPVPVSLLFYTLATSEESLQPQISDEGRVTIIDGEMETLGKFKIRFKAADPANMVLKYNYLNTKVLGGTAHLKEAILRSLALFQSKDGKFQILGLVGDASQPRQGFSPEKGNHFLVHQVTFVPPFSMEVAFESGSSPSRTDPLSGQTYEMNLKAHSDAFDRKFKEMFQLHSKGYEDEDVKTAQSILSNMLGGIGYFHGSSMVQSSYNKNPVSYWPAPLYSAVPSRSFFPRGFLWDEGFHNLLILHWNANITKDIIGHWLDLMNVEGWIPREQILGSEARERVPAEFLVQKNTNANPPTFFLTLEILLRQMRNGNIPQDKGFFLRALPRLKTWFQWFNRTQNGMLPGTYRWRGRDGQTAVELNPKTLSSGLDDYPRASHPTIDERHVDLRCWIAFSSKVLADIYEYVGQPSAAYQATNRYLSDNQLLDELHWSPISKSYSDFGFHSTDVRLVKQPLPIIPGHHEEPRTETVRITNEQPILRFVNNFGYVSLFPFFLQIIDPHNSKLGKVLDDLKDPRLLWTTYGLRSLSKTSPYYMKYNTEHDPPYWRGPIWINMNFLAVRALHHYAQTQGPYQKQSRDLYAKLRKNVVTNILKEYSRTGFIWEQYNDKTGYGQGAHPFTGWSSLVVLIMAELY